jgi:glycine cleavage system aminomethyltransferase T
LAGGQIVGRTFSSYYSPSLRRAIALAQIQTAAASMTLTLSIPPTMECPQMRSAAAHIADLPFLATPDPIAP